MKIAQCGQILDPSSYLYLSMISPQIYHPHCLCYLLMTNLLFMDPSRPSIEADITESTKHPLSCLYNKKLLLNVGKTASITFNLTQLSTRDICTIMLNNKTINQRASTKFLVDQYLKWDAHRDYVAKKLSITCYVFRIISKVCDMYTLNSVYFSFTNSTISYGIPFWGLTHKKIFIMQKRILKIMKGVPIKTPTKPIFRELKNFASTLFIHFKNGMFYKQKFEFI